MQELFVDEYFNTILQKVHTEDMKVMIHPDGTFAEQNQTTEQSLYTYPEKYFYLSHLFFGHLHLYCIVLFVLVFYLYLYYILYYFVSILCSCRRGGSTKENRNICRDMPGWLR